MPQFPKRFIEDQDDLEIIWELLSWDLPGHQKKKQHFSLNKHVSRRSMRPDQASR